MLVISHRTDSTCSIRFQVILTHAPCVEPLKSNPKSAHLLVEKRRVNFFLEAPSVQVENAIPISEVIFHPEYLNGYDQ
jgi:hypothetical protein